MIKQVETDSAFLAQFERLESRLAPESPPWLSRLRRAAIAHFAELGFPTTRQEDWRFTDLSPLVQVPFEPAPLVPTEGSGASLEQLLAAGESRGPAARISGGLQIVAVNGRYKPELSSTAGLPGGVIVASLAEAAGTHPELVEPHLGRHAPYREHAFVALNTALAEDGVFLYLPRGAALEDPIHLIHAWTSAERPAAAHPRNLIVAASGAQARVVERYVGPPGSVYFTNAVTEIVLEPGAILEHYTLQREGDAAFHMATVQVLQQRESAFFSLLASLGGSLVRSETNVVLDGEGCDCTLYGLCLARAQQHCDSRTRIDHASPHCRSRELYKAILDDRARGVFNGKIYVHQDAQKTDAKQTNQTLLLAQSATINTKPQLEIFADDVKCTHGATVGQLDQEALFYLRSRGVPHDLARNLLIYAFANDVVGRASVEAVRAELEKVLLSARGLSADPAGKEAV